MMNENVRILFDNLRDGLLIVSSSDLRIIYVNPAARQVATLETANVAPEWLSSQIDSIRQDHVTLPVTLELSLSGIDGKNHLVCVTVLNSPVATDYVIILDLGHAGTSRNNRIANSNIAEMLDCEFLAPMADFQRAVTEMQAHLKAIPDAGIEIYSSIASVNRKAEILSDSLSQIHLMAEAFKYNPIQSDERIDLSLLIDDVLKEVSRLLISRQVRVSFSGINDNLPSIYASRKLLMLAIAGYVRHLVGQIESGMHILFSFRTNGYFALLTLNNFGRIPPLDKIGRRYPAWAERPVAGESDGISLSLSMCQRVIELCGGNLRLEKSDGMLASITFELPIGSPKNRDEEYIRQAQRYAEDLASLIKQTSIQDMED